MRLAVLLYGGLLSLLTVTFSLCADPHSFSNYALVSHPHIKLDLTADFTKKQLSGFVELELQWHHLDTRELVLDTRDLTILRVMGQAKSGQWQRLNARLGQKGPNHGQALHIHCHEQYDKVRVYYHTRPEASGLQWLSKEQTSEKQQPFLFSQSQSIHARSWIPLQDTPERRLTFSARIQTPKELLAVMGADNSANQERDGDYQFQMPQPIPAYLIALAVGDLHFQDMSEKTGVYAEKFWLDKAVGEFADTEQLMQVASSLYGDYAWGRYDILVLPASFPFGGMENPRVSFVTPTIIAGDKSLVSLIAHELAHSWSGNLVTNASWHELWLNEGFTNYVENRLMEAVFGKERALIERVLSVEDLQAELPKLAPQDTQLVSDYTGRDPDEAFTQVPYVKGMLFLQFLEKRFGREKFDAFLQSYFKNFAFQNMTTERFLRFLRQTLLQEPDIVSFGEVLEWLYTPGLPETFEAPVSPLFEQVSVQQANWLAGNDVHALQTHLWSIHEWLYFIHQLPSSVTLEQLTALDNAFKLSQSQNAEIASAWFKLTIAKGYAAAQAPLAQFLQQVGRRKLVVPLYQQLAQTPALRALGVKIYEQAKAGYHPLTQIAVERVLEKGQKK